MKGVKIISTIFLSLSEIQAYINKLVEDELSYNKDKITTEGWNIIENISPKETFNYITEYEDINEITFDDINRIYSEILDHFEPSCGYRLSLNE